MKIKLTKKQRKFIKEDYRYKSDAALARELKLPVEHIRYALKAIKLRRTKDEERAIRKKEEDIQRAGKRPPKVARALRRPLFIKTAVSLMVLILISYLLYGHYLHDSPIRYARKFQSLIAPRKPSDLNILLLIIDTLRADHLGCYGYQGAKTPHIDRLAEEGILFTNATCQVPLTLPSHCSILTGTHPMYHGVRDNAGFYLGEENTTLAEILKGYGYATSGFIGAFVLDSRWGIDQGFDYYFDNFDIAEYDIVMLENVQRRGKDVVDEASHWWDKNGHNKFFTWIHLYDPHSPYDAPEPYKTMFRGKPYGLYDGEIAYTDMLIGQIMAKLEEKGVLDNTLIIFTSDHGEMLGEHSESRHGFFIYDAATRIPLIIKPPTTALKGRVIEAQVQSVDIVSTILHMLGIPIPREVQGQSLLPLLLRKSRDNKKLYAYSETFYPRYYYGWSELKSLRTRQYKYIQAPRPELYDLIKDPRENRNILSSNPRIAERFKKKLTEIANFYAAKGVEQKGPQKMDEESLKGLMALGYLGSYGVSLRDRKDRELADPKDKIKLFNKIKEAEGKYLENKIDEALQKMTEVLEVDPDIMEAQLVLGRLYMLKQDTEKAIAAFKRALEINPQFEFAIFSLALAYKESKQWAEAIAGFRRLTEMDPRDSRAFLHLSDIYIEQKDFDQAIICLKKAIEVQPEPDAAAHSQLGLCYLQNGMLQQAEQELKRALEFNPKILEAHFNLGLVYKRLARYTEAIEAFKEVIRIKPDFADAYFHLGLAHGSLGRYNEEMEAMKSVVRIKPDYADAHYILALHYIRLGDRASALEEHEILKTLNPALANKLFNQLNR
ncbi:MAG: sulfatase-like hydrolase/transferase [Candidatus Aminicenantes bacterium]|nr:sulfatase-like hydrolase/transferase [Candidatus Aminicenantes bacterium]